MDMFVLIPEKESGSGCEFQTCQKWNPFLVAFKVAYFAAWPRTLRSIVYCPWLHSSLGEPWRYHLSHAATWDVYQNRETFHFDTLE